VNIAALLLPNTNACFGRKSKPQSHRLYVTDLAEHIDKACLQFRDIDGKNNKPGTMLLELRIGGGGKGAQSVFPGSVHGSGEQIEWFDHGDPIKIEGTALLKATRRLAAIVLLARHWPIEGARHKAALTIGGFLARAGLSANEAVIMVEAIAKAANDREWADRAAAARDSVNKYASDGRVYGLPALIEAFGSDVVNKIIEWLEYKSPPQPDPKQPEPPPPRHTLVEVHSVFQRWLSDDYDIDALDATCAAGACARLTGDPLWLLIISGPGAAKTETAQSLAGAGAQVTSTIASEGALLSATSRKSKVKDATGGLLRKLGNNGVLVIKDVTSILSADRHTRGPVLAAIREIYDGRYRREVGTDGGQTLTWEGRIVVVGPCTTAWDSAHSVISIMGDRFVILRIDSTHGRRNSGLRAIRNTGDEVKMRNELANAVGGLIAHASVKETRITEEETNRLVDAADIVTLARTAVEFDHKGDVSIAHAPEMPTRFAKQLTQIIRAGVAIGLPRKQGMRLAIRCARDSIPPLRLEILLDIAANPRSRAGDIRKRIRKPWRTVKRQLDALTMLGVLAIDEESETETKPDGTEKTMTYEVYDLNTDFDRATLKQMADITPNEAVQKCE
jgi:DNA-binding transcriptional ArsR family regulator